MSCGCQNDLNLILPVGTSPTWAISIIDPENAGAAIDITGAEFAFFVKNVGTDADADSVFTLTSGNSEIVITSAASGFAQISNTVAKSNLLTAGTVYYCSLRITFESGEIRTVRQGTLTADTA